MVGLFYILLPMSFSIPHQIEQDIIAGRASYRTFQTGNGGQSILQVPTNSYAVIYGYDFSPAGGGIFAQEDLNALPELTDDTLRFFQTQQISFFTGNDFFPFIHHVNLYVNPFVSALGLPLVLTSIDNTPISRPVYITSTNDVTITHGLILEAGPTTSNAIPITNRTPPGLTYGGSLQVMNTQTNYGAGGNPVQFMQPSPKDYQDFGFGLLPGNADNQAFATPDVLTGLLASSLHLQNIGGDAFQGSAAANYYLCLHYALYTATVPEQRG